MWVRISRGNVEGIKCCEGEVKDRFDLKGLEVRDAPLKDRGLARQQEEDTQCHW